MNQGTILLVDDDIAVREVCDRVLRREGFEVILASNVEEARRVLKTQPVTLLITDLKMPEEGGMDLLEWLHEHHPGLPTVVISAYPSMENVRRSLELGVREYVVKPFKIEELLSAVQRSLHPEENAEA